jgi:lysophospholipase L1-like esterase
MSALRKILILLLILLAVAAIIRSVFFWPITNRHPSGTNIIAFGDSLTYGTGAQPGQDYPTLLSEMIGQPVLNKGVPGDTTEDALKRLDKDVLKQDPKIVIVLLGGNDLLNRLPAETTFGNLRRIVSEIQDTGALVVLAGVDGPVFTTNLAPRFRKLARSMGCVYVKNVLSGILTDLSLKSDQVHPNSKGYRIIAERISRKIKPFLK